MKAVRPSPRRFRTTNLPGSIRLSPVSESLVVARPVHDVVRLPDVFLHPPDVFVLFLDVCIRLLDVFVPVLNVFVCLLDVFVRRLDVLVCLLDVVEVSDEHLLPPRCPVLRQACPE